MADPQTPAPAPPKPPPPPPLLVPKARWRFAPYLANRAPGYGTLTLDEVRALCPGGKWILPSARIRRAGYDYSAEITKLRGDSAIWARAAEPAEVKLGVAVRAAVLSGRHTSWGATPYTSWHLPHDPEGSGTLRRWRPALPGDAPEVLRMIRDQPWAPGEELVVQTGTSPEVVSRLMRQWVKGWAP